MRIDQLEKDYRLAYIHNPKDFYPNSFQIEPAGRRVLVVGKVKKHLRKGFRRVAILKPKKLDRTS